MTTATRKMFAHQKHAVRWMVSHRNRPYKGVRLKGGILADDMGLGKTFAALIAAHVHHQADGAEIVVLAPKSLCGNWTKEARMAGVRVNVYSSSKIPAEGRVEQDHQGKPKKVYSPSEGLPARYVLLADEAHYFQNMKSDRTQRFLALAMSDRCVAVYPLTGTPIKNGRPVNLLPLLKAIGHPLANNPKAYEVRYCAGRLEQVVAKNVKTGERVARQVWKNDGATNLVELHEITKGCILRRLKGECLDLPEKVRSLVEVEPEDDARRAYDETFARLRAEYRRRLANDEITGFGDHLVMLSNLRRAASIAKAPTAVEMVEEVLEQGGQAVVSCEFKDGANIVANHFGVRVFDGSLSTAQRDEMVARFQAGDQKVIVLMGKAGGVGITLTAGQTIILLDRPWTPGDAVQIEDRVHRIGQAGMVNAYWLQYGAADTKVDNVLMQKQENIEEVLHGQRNGLAFCEASFARQMAAAIFGD